MRVLSRPNLQILIESNIYGLRILSVDDIFMQNEIDTGSYAIVRFAGKNYKVFVGREFEVDGLGPCDAGAEIVVDKVLVRVSGSAGSSQGEPNKAGAQQGNAESDNIGTVKIGTPFLSESKVALRVMSSRRGKKVLIFKKRRRGGYTKYQGHRQVLTRVVVDRIEG